MMICRSLPRILASLACLAVFSSAAGADTRYDNTYAKDFITDAPWRVVDAQTPIPITIVLKDCDVDDIRELHWIRCTDVTGGGSTVLWHHDFGDERIGDDASEHNYWTYITTVTEGHPSLPDGTPLAPAALGYGPGDAIQLEVSIYYRDDWFNYTAGRTLRVHVGSGPFPWPQDWYGGDTHLHTMYTNNLYEFGAPVPAVRLAAAAVGLDWLTATDHSCDLDETGDGAYSYATHQWEYTIQSASGTTAVVRNNLDHGSSWGALGADAAEADGPGLRVYRGVEINLASVDPDTYGKTLHCLFYNPEYIASPLSGAPGERPVTPSLAAGLDALEPEGFAYAAHPLSDLSAEFGGIDIGVNGTRWRDQDLAEALARGRFIGLEAFNTRATRRSSNQENPWADFDAGTAPDNPYPNELLEGIALWDSLLAADIASGDPRRIFLSGGSDAHGDFNYASYMSLDNYAEDNAIGKVQSVVHVPGYGPDSLPPIGAILAAFRGGRSVVTDGPFLEIGLDLDGDEDWYEDGDVAIGGEGTVGTTSPLPLRIRWTSLPEFGPAVSVALLSGDGTGTATLASFDPTVSGEGLSGTETIDIQTFGFEGTRFFRAELLTADGDAGHRAYTNPIWLTFDPSVGAAAGAPAAALSVALSARPNPFNPETTILFRLSKPAPVLLTVLDPGGRLVRTLLSGEPLPEGPHAVVWDGTDRRGAPAPSGIYLTRLVAGAETRTAKLLLVR
ncbi:MAG: FlgD immunoglobulin-like domain containing protein [Candidatus Eisenbacteria bacterium]